MEVRLAYGKEGLMVNVPHDALVVEPHFVPGLTDEKSAILNALRAPIGSLPLHSLVKPGDRVVVVHTDITRAMPNDRVLPILLNELETVGIPRENITLLNALGTHRRQTNQELVDMLSEQVALNYHCEQHDCWDDKNLVPMGKTKFGHDVRINRTYMEADVKILTGFIEPHFFAGFSGGPKGVLPSVAGIESVLTNHGAQMLRHPQATWGITKGNPLWEEMLDVALMTKPTFLLNVTLNRNKEITGVFAGDLEKAHAAGCDFCRESAMVPVAHKFDVVITSNSGYPLDLNLYQTVKGMSAAAQIVKEGGSIIIASECWDGIPEHGEYARLLRTAENSQKLLEHILNSENPLQDQWQAQTQTQIQQIADIYVYSDCLSDEQINDSLLIPCRSIEDSLTALQKKYGQSAQICVLPEGPLTIPYVVPES